MHFFCLTLFKSHAKIVNNIRKLKCSEESKVNFSSPESPRFAERGSRRFAYTQLGAARGIRLLTLVTL